MASGDYAGWGEKISHKKIPEKINANLVHKIEPGKTKSAFYESRTDRNLGWISREEQLTLRQSTIGIAGCGGIGGYLAETLHRLGVGCLKLADKEVFDASNINRQWGARAESLGKSKVLETARQLRAISSDSEIHLYPKGINRMDVNSFCDKCQLICDNIDFWSPGTRILLHQTARKLNIPVLNFPAIGFGGAFFVFPPDGTRLEDFIELELNEALAFERDFRLGTSQPNEIERIAKKILFAFVPTLPSYTGADVACKDIDQVVRELLQQGKASVLSTNIPFVVGFAANRILLYLLKETGLGKRDLPEVPDFPGYCYLDAAKLEIEACERKS